MKPGLEGHFKFLGCWLNAKLSNKQIKEMIRASLMDDIEKIDQSRVNGVMKLWLYQFQAITRIAWPFLIQDLDRSFAEKLESNISFKLKSWLGVNSQADTGRLFLSRDNMGFGLTSISDQFKQMQIIKHQLLKTSADDDIRTLRESRDAKENSLGKKQRIWKASTHSAVAEAAALHEQKYPHQSDRLGLGHARFNNKPSPKEWRKLVLSQHKLITEEKRLAHSHQLALQGVWTKWKHCTETFDLSWRNLIYTMSPRLVKFVANAMINMVKTPSLLKLWGYTKHATCALCKHQNCTLHHIISNCEVSLAGGRYNWRHDSVLRGLDLALGAHTQSWNAAKPKRKLVPHISVSFGKKPSSGSQVSRECLLDGARDWKIVVDYDLSPMPFPVEICDSDERPDIVLWSPSARRAILIELTCPAEEGIDAARSRKEAKYNKHLVPLIKRNGWAPILMTVEVGARGCPGRSLRKCLRRVGLKNTLTGTVVKAVSLTAARCSLYLYQSRESPDWDRKRERLVGAYSKLQPPSKVVKTEQKRQHVPLLPFPPAPIVSPVLNTHPPASPAPVMRTPPRSPSMSMSLLSSPQYRYWSSLLRPSVWSHLVRPYVSLSTPVSPIILSPRPHDPHLYPRESHTPPHSPAPLYESINVIDSSCPRAPRTSDSPALSS
jgi:hypothetical protein